MQFNVVLLCYLIIIYIISVETWTRKQHFNVVAGRLFTVRV